jgi:transcriptional regulator with XRE-family HTH domain
MPRLAKSPQANLPRIRKELWAYLKKAGLTPTAFATEMGVSQSTVQRFLAARTKTVTPKMKPLLEYADINLNICIDDVQISGIDNARIRQALDKVWDGRESTAEILAKLIESVGPAIVQASQRGVP